MKTANSSFSFLRVGRRKITAVKVFIAEATPTRKNVNEEFAVFI
jgi:hypothetical protein